MEAIMKSTIRSLAITATMLLAVTVSSAQSVTSPAAVPVHVSASLLSARAPDDGVLRDATVAAPSSLDGLLMFALAASLVAIQLRRRQKALRTPLLRN